MTLYERIKSYRQEYEDAVERRDDPEIIGELYLQWQEAEDQLNENFLSDFD
jgi:hypothetical protein